uniref:Uncharacterized protein n=1 Tax=Timspurckia oligopyrenoides TaxID=708627 RepID=A0A7S1ESJ6_9RHOD|mmetsp:Transcript_4310/g.7564  ORF Transcript_4310/g.7564 Transcript_4310/m.7564 type:complete len:158 (+) Transcript_4310:56-529(+)
MESSMMCFVGGCEISAVTENRFLKGTSVYTCDAKTEQRGSYSKTICMGKPRYKKVSLDDIPQEAEADWRTGKIDAPRRGVVGAKKANIRTQGRPLQRGVPEKKRNVLRIFGGSAKGRKIISPDVYLRPMMGKVREALFSMVCNVFFSVWILKSKRMS